MRRRFTKQEGRNMGSLGMMFGNWNACFPIRTANGNSQAAGYSSVARTFVLVDSLLVERRPHLS